MSKITILSVYDRIACFHTLRPFLTYRDRKLFHYTNSAEYCLKKDKNSVLIMVRWFLKPDYVDLDLMRKLRDKYRTIIFFHDDAGGGIPRAQVLPYVDLFYQKALFRDRSLYLRSLYGKELYSDYAHRKFGVEDPSPVYREPVKDSEQLEKLRLSWNIGIGQFPRRKYSQRFAVALARLADLRLVRMFYSPVAKYDAGKLTDGSRRDIAVHARFGLVSQPSLADHRKRILAVIEGDSRFLTGEVGQKQYNRELARSLAVLSPFGWGELCFRDFEAVLSGALLIKPDMSHLETWPDIFVDRETYIGFSWDAVDLIEKTEEILDNRKMLKYIAQSAYTVYHDQLDRIDEYFESILDEIMSV